MSATGNANMKCKDCEVVKDIEEFENTGNGEARRSVCKKCRSAKKRLAVENSKHQRDPSSTPMPTKCSKCSRSYPEVQFKWRNDTVTGRWRNECNSCFSAKGYYKAYRSREIQKDAVAYRARHASTHLAWAHRNPDKVAVQQQLARTDPTRKFKYIITYVKQKYGEDKVDTYIEFNDAEAMQEKMTRECNYCGLMPASNDKLNGLDRVDPRGKYEDKNTVPCCGICNAMKLTFSIDEFIQGVREIVAFQKINIDEVLSQNIQRPVVLNSRMEKRTTAKGKSQDLGMSIRLDLLSSPCYLCSRCPSFGVDRVDSTKPYVIANCRGCCTTCNFMKKNASLNEFLAHIARIHAHTKMWVLGDTDNVLSTVMGTRKPIAATSIHNGHTIMFPSTGCAANIIGSTEKTITQVVNCRSTFREFQWNYVNISEYKKQKLDKAKCIDLLTIMRIK